MLSLVFRAFQLYESEYTDRGISSSRDCLAHEIEFATTRVGIRDECLSENSPFTDAGEIGWMPGKYQCLSNVEFGILDDGGVKKIVAQQTTLPRLSRVDTTSFLMANATRKERQSPRR